MRGIVLYGPPASGKDTITKALQDIDARYAHFPRLKAGPGRSSGYRMTTVDAIARLEASGEIIWRNSRYNAIYAIDRGALLTALTSAVPVLHLGQPEAIDAVRAATAASRWTVVALWCPRDVTRTRLIERSDQDVEQRLKVWDETPSLPSPDLTINTNVTSPEMSARLVSQHAKEWTQ